MKTYVIPTLEVSALSFEDVITSSGELLSHLRVVEGDAEVGANSRIDSSFWN